MKITEQPQKPPDDGVVISALDRLAVTLSEADKVRLGNLIKNVKELIDNEPSLIVSTMALASVSVARDPGLVDGIKKEINRFYDSKAKK